MEERVEEEEDVRVDVRVAMGTGTFVIGGYSEEYTAAVPELISTVVGEAKLSRNVSGDPTASRSAVPDTALRDCVGGEKSVLQQQSDGKGGGGAHYTTAN